MWVRSLEENIVATNGSLHTCCGLYVLLAVSYFTNNVQTVLYYTSMKRDATVGGGRQ